MLYFKQKLKLYRKITGLTYPELATLLDVPMSSLHYILNKGQTIPTELVTKFNDLLTEVRLHHIELDEKLKPQIRISTFWPELYAPYLYDVSHLVAKNGYWGFVRSGSGEPVYREKVWKSQKEGSMALWDLSITPLPVIIIPEWPLPDELSCLRQTSDGWVKVTSLETVDETDTYSLSNGTRTKADSIVPSQMLKQYGKWHIPGNSEISEFQQTILNLYQSKTGDMLHGLHATEDGTI